MKSIIYSVFCFSYFFFSSCGENKKQTAPTDIVNIPATAEQGIDRSDLPVLKFEEEVFDFGDITQGEKVSHNFKFENTGKKDLIISNAYADCGCTVPEIPKQPIPPGKTNSIRVTFDSDQKTGVVTKQISILTNCIPNTQVIKIKATIFVPQTNNK